MMKPLSECRLYAFVDTAYLHGRQPEQVARQLCEGGADLIQLRAKQSSAEEIRRMAEAIAPITRAAGVGLVINDYLAIAQEVGADFCHLGQEDFFDAGYTHVSQLPLADSCLSRFSTACEADRGRGRERGRFERPLRTRLESGIKIGLSTHAPEQAQRALAAGADYVAIGPIYATGTKPTARPVTLEYVRWAAAKVTTPWFAIGGINLNNLDEVLAAGARRICVVSAILNAPDIAQTCRQFRKRLG